MAMGYRTNYGDPMTLGALARGKVVNPMVQRNPGIADPGGEGIAGVANPNATPTYTGPQLTGQGPQVYPGKEVRARAMFDRIGPKPGPQALPNGMLDYFSGADDASRIAMFGDLSSPFKRQIASQFGAANGMTENDVLNRYAGGGDTTGSTYKPGQFGLDASTTARWTQPKPMMVNGAPVGAGGAAAGGFGSIPMGGAGPAAQGSAGTGSPGYGVNVADYLDPSMRFQMDEGMRALENSAAARGSLQSGGTLRDILRYSQGLASQDYGNAFGRAANVRDFNYGVDVGDRAFDYGAQRDDRNFNYGTLRDLAQMGLSATGQAAGGENALAGILAGLLSNRGQIAGTGAIGGSNAITGSISQIINMLLQNNALGSIGGR